MRFKVGHKLSVTHGMSSTPEYKSWSGMISRCENPNTPSYKYCGARGIKVCRRWRFSFEKFFADVGFRPTPSHSIDRRNNKKGYFPSNVRWATKKEQSDNRPGFNRPLRLGRITMNLTDWARSLGISRESLRDRLDRHGWSVKDALTRRKGDGIRRSNLSSRAGWRNRGERYTAEHAT